MEPGLKKILKSVTLELRHLLEGRYDAAGVWQPGDLERRLAAIGERRGIAGLRFRSNELPHLIPRMKTGKLAGWWMRI